MKPMNRVDIIVGKLKPSGKTVSMERKDDMMSKDFVQKIDMDESDMMYESCGEAIMNAIKQHDAKALAEALCDLMDLHESGPHKEGSGASEFNESDDGADEDEAY